MASQVIINAVREGYGTDQIRRTLTVREFIEQLERYDDDAKLYLSFDNGYTYGGITTASIDEKWVDEDEDADDYDDYDENDN